jgi:hypothetical protein
VTYQIPTMHAIAITSSGERRRVDVTDVCFGSLNLQITLCLSPGEPEIKGIVCFDVYSTSDGVETVAAKYEKGYPFTNLKQDHTFTLCYRLG